MFVYIQIQILTIILTDVANFVFVIIDILVEFPFVVLELFGNVEVVPGADHETGSL